MESKSFIPTTRAKGAPAPAFQGLPLVLGLVLFALTLWAFLPAVDNDFVRYDDLDYVTSNYAVQRGLGWDGVVWAFTSTTAANWHPLTWLSHMLDCQLFGLNPVGHHLTSILLHAVNTLLVFLVLRSLTGATWRSFLVAACFGWHPLRVESVAWVAERKDVLCTLFWLLTLGAYAGYVRELAVRPARSKISFGLALVAFSGRLDGQTDDRDPAVCIAAARLLAARPVAANEMARPGTGEIPVPAARRGRQQHHLRCAAGRRRGGCRPADDLPPRQRTHR
ncbi:MAG: hypothetical protein V9H26_05500 [Verrucomicrobiota bacterium]